MTSEKSKQNGISKRRLMQAMGTGLSTMVAGCTGNGGGNADDGELGERVPTIVYSHFANYPRLELSAPVFQDGLERLGLDVEIQTADVTEVALSAFDDDRNSHFQGWAHGATPDRIDPHELTRRYAIDYAGANGSPSPNQYASCEFSDPAIMQANAASIEQRRELVHEAQSIMSHDLAVIPWVRLLTFSVINTNIIDPNNLGNGGFELQNLYAYATSRLKQGESITTVVESHWLDTTTWPKNPITQTVWGFSNYFHTPLLGYDQNLNLENALAKDMNISADGKTITFKLREATFHNGDNITSEDVKFTFDLLQENTDVFISASKYDEIDSISAPSNDTVVFNLTKPVPALVGREIPKWGILHKPSWEPAMDNPDDFQWEAPFIGSGPWKIESFESGGGQIIASPHDGNPILKPDHGLILKSMETLATKLQAFKARELDVITNIKIADTKNIVEDMGEDNVMVLESFNFMNRPIYPQMSNPPVNFKVFRKAAAMSLDSKLIAELIFEGEVGAPEHQSIWSKNHPWRPPEEDLLRIDPASNIEEARAELMNAGWGWDSQDRLHYPPDANISPPWPKGEVPSPTDFSCIDSEGGWIHPDNR